MEQHHNELVKNPEMGSCGRRRQSSNIESLSLSTSVMVGRAARAPRWLAQVCSGGEPTVARLAGGSILAKPGRRGADDEAFPGTVVQQD